MTRPRVLVGVMFHGEQEYPACQAALRGQQGVDLEVLGIENLRNKEAHDHLYAEFNRRRQDFDMLAKVDADMVLKAPDVLAAVARVFTDNPTLDHLMVDVADYLSDMPIPGQNFYSSRVEWKGNEDSLIVDYHGTFPGASHRVMDNPVATHMSNPSEFQSFSFGVHRCLKAVQPDRGALDISRALLHWTIISNIFHAYRRLGDDRRLLALGGAQVVLEHPDPRSLMDYKSADLEAQFSTQWRQHILSDKNRAMQFWMVPLRAMAIWLQRASQR